MPIISFQNLSCSFADFDLFMGLSGRIEMDSKIGLVGPNGAGKTTLLQMLTGITQPTGGTISRDAGVAIGYLRQEAVQAFADRQNTLYAEMLTAVADVLDMEAQMRAIETRMTAGTANDADYEAYGELQERYELRGGYDYEYRIERTLQGLGFDEADREKPLHILSGGQKTRALLARLLISKPQLLILDEPTNHLDVDAVNWLEGTLKTWDGAVLVVSHDRYFLDTVTNTIWELTPAGLDSYRGNYSAYLQQKEHNQSRTSFEWEAMMERFMKELEYIERMTLENPNAVGRFKRLTREVEAVERHGIEALRVIKSQGWAAYTNQYDRKRPVDKVRDLRAAIKRLEHPIQRHRQMHVRLSAGERSGDDVLRGRDLHIGYPDELLFTVEKLDLQRGDVAALIGPNGSGKSTFLRTLLGEIKPLRGTLTIGANVQIGYFAQAHDALDMDNRVIDEIIRHRPGMKISEARSHLGPYLFSGDDAFKPVAKLSGGERGRLALAVLALNGANFLLLDEPTNHLDVPAQEVLQSVLESFEGTVLLVSHDRYLVDRLATQIWKLEGGRLRVYEGDYQYYLRQQAAEQEAAARQQPRPAPQRTNGKGDRTAADTRRLAELESRISALEASIEELNQLLIHASAAGSSPDIERLSKEHHRQQAQLGALLAEWEAAAEAVI